MGVDGYYIISLESKDIYEQELINGIDKGYILPSKKDNKFFDLFNAVLDYSLDLFKLENIYETKCRKKFYIEGKNNNKYTLSIINVKFNFKYKDIENHSVFTCKDLRKHFYEQGFYLNGTHYVRYKRSSGSSRKGKCLFIDERLYKSMCKWGECSLKQNSKDLASWESYKSLSLSSIKGTIDIPLDGILFIKDYKSKFKEDVISVEKGSNGKLIASSKEEEIVNDIWDGESLLDESLFKDKYKDKHMLLLRNKFFKSCAFKTKLQKWFKDKNITLEGLKELGFVTLAKDISQIVMVTTPNSMKFLKFMDKGLTLKNVTTWLNNISSQFGVVKYDKRTKYFNGNMVRTSYQFLNTLALNEEDVISLLKPSQKYITTLRNDYDFLRFHFSEAIKRENDGEIDEISDGLAERSDVIFKLMNINYQFENTRLFVDFRNDVIEDQKNKIKEGHILLSGTNATLFGNGPEMLLCLANEFDINNEDNEPVALKKNEIAIKKFPTFEKLVCARSPHITMGNIYCATNNLSSSLWDYFDLGNNIVCVNAIKENIQQRLNGCDYDSDAMLITNDKLVVEKAFKEKDTFKVPVCKIDSKGISNLPLYELDHKTSENKIGQIVNLSQKLNSLIWHEINNNKDKEKIDKLYLNVCKLAVLSGIEIDKAKRAYDEIDVNKELTIIKEKCIKKEFKNPMFFKIIYENYESEYNLKDNKKEFQFYDSPMEYIYKHATDNIDFRKGKEKNTKYIQISDMLNISKIKFSSNAYYIRDNILKELNKYKEILDRLYKELRFSDEDDKEVFYIKIKETKQERNNEILKLLSSSSNENVLFLVIKEIEKTNQENYQLYAPLLDCEIFKNLIKESKERMKHVIYNKEGEYNLYHLKFTKI